MAFNIGSSEEVSVADLVQRMFGIVEADASWHQPLPAVETSEGYPGDAGRRWPDSSQSEAILGWKARTNLNDGLTSMWIERRDSV